MFKIFGALKRQINLYIEFNRSISDLRYLTAQKPEESVELNNLISWVRKEYSKRPKQYPGDHVFINMVKEKVIEGYLLEQATKKVNEKLSKDFQLMDIVIKNFGY